MKSILSNQDTLLKEGDVIIRVSEKYFRPTEVETLLGDSSNASSDLNWKPKITIRELCNEMIESDLLRSKQRKLLVDSTK